MAAGIRGREMILVMDKAKAIKKTERKPYHTPRLKDYGDLRRIVRVKPGTKGDGAGVPATKR
jgi:hypothetical protein